MRSPSGSTRSRSAFALVAGLALLGGCSSDPMSEVTYNLAPSATYSEDEVREAADVVVDHWTALSEVLEDFGSVTYTGELDSDYWASQYDGDEVIVLTVDFTTNDKAPEMGLNGNDKYTDYKEILVRNDGGPWRVVDGGYG